MLLLNRRSKRCLYGPSLSKAIAQRESVDPKFACPLRNGMGFVVVGEQSCKMLSTGCFCGRKDFLDSPSKCNTMPDSADRNACLSSPVRDAHRLPVVCKQVSSGGISRLLRLRSPTAISRLVVSFVVNSVNCVQWAWLSPHVIQEMLKRRAPAVANRNAPPTVAFVFMCVWVGASLYHRVPSRIFGSLFLPTATTTALAMFDSIVDCGRLVSRHDSTPIKLDCDRAAGRPQSLGCSHYYAPHGRVVQ